MERQVGLPQQQAFSTFDKSENTNISYQPPPPQPRYDFPTENLKIKKVIGGGAFGQVAQGLAFNIQSQKPGWSEVAVKMLKGLQPVFCCTSYSLVFC